MKKKSVRLVDDDDDEVRRFRTHIQDRYVVGAGRTLNDAFAELRNKGVRKPDLFLDVYYGPNIDEDKRSAIADAYERLSRETMELQTRLLRAGQSTKGGFALAEEARNKYTNVPLAFFSRKALLKDAEDAYEENISVLKKPDPDNNEKGQTRSQRYDAAFLRHRDEIYRRIDRTIGLNGWWVRHRQLVEGCAMGVGTSLVAALAWHLLHLP